MCYQGDDCLCVVKHMNWWDINQTFGPVWAIYSRVLIEMDEPRVEKGINMLQASRAPATFFCFCRTPGHPTVSWYYWFCSKSYFLSNLVDIFFHFRHFWLLLLDCLTYHPKYCYLFILPNTKKHDSTDNSIKPERKSAFWLNELYFSCFVISGQ